jgi:hypothetical protein
MKANKYVCECDILANLSICLLVCCAVFVLFFDRALLTNQRLMQLVTIILSRCIKLYIFLSLRTNKNQWSLSLFFSLYFFVLFINRLYYYSPFFFLLLRVDIEKYTKNVLSLDLVWLFSFFFYI